MAYFSPRFRTLLIASSFAAAASGAEASLRICNDSERRQSVTIGYQSAEGWLSRGWWNVEPGACVTPIGDPLEQRYYYLRAEHRGSPFKGEGYTFCTDRDAFRIIGDTDCEARGYETQDYLEIDIGAGNTSFTYRMTEEVMSAAQGISGAAEGLEFCNETEVTQAVTIGYQRDDGQWVSRGWWNVAPDTCSAPIDTALTRRYYYYRAEVRGGPFNGGGYTFCTQPEAFDIVGDTDCESRGYVTEDFAEIDLGTVGAPSHRVLLTAATGGVIEDGAAASPPPPPDAPEQVGLRFCNETGDTQGISIGYEGDEGWTSEGWWNVEPGACREPLPGPLTKRYYYYRAEVRSGPFEGGGYSFCTTPEPYTIVGDTDCEARGYESEDFAEIDIGAGNDSYTVTLTAANSGIIDDSNSGSTDPSAGLQVCNDTDEVQNLTIGFEADDGWTSKGWWVIDPGDCSRPVAEALTNRYYYYRAETNDGRFAGGGYSFCVTPEAFTILGDQNCEARGYETADFAELDLGAADVGSYLLRLVTPASGGASTGGSTGPSTTPNPPAPTTAGGTDVIDASAAGLEVCNDTDLTQSLAFGYEGAEGWTSEGWWVLEPGACEQPALDGQRHAFLYYRAEDDSESFMGESYFFCVEDEAFTIVGDSDCTARGYERADFREIEMSAEGLFTLRLTPAQAVGGGDEGTPTPVVTGGGSAGGTTTLGDRLGGAAPTPDPVPAPVPTPDPVPAPDPVPDPEPAPDPEPDPVPPSVVPAPDPAPDPTAPAPRRTGSRG